MKPSTKVEIINDGRFIIWDFEESQEIYNMGFYGKPLGLSKPDIDFEAPLILDPIEGVYLKEKGIIEIYREKGDQEVTLEDLIEFSMQTHERFDEKYRVYRDLRNKGWVVTPGIKYGCDFTVYRHGPGLDHAPFIIQIMLKSQQITASEIVKAGRLATTVRKNFIIASVDDDNITYLEFKWWRA